MLSDHSFQAKLHLKFFCFINKALASIFSSPLSGDRILAVNGKSLEYVSHDEAVQALKNTPVNVELLVSQSSRTDCDIGKKRLEVTPPSLPRHCEKVN